MLPKMLPYSSANRVYYYIFRYDINRWPSWRLWHIRRTWCLFIAIVRRRGFSAVGRLVSTAGFPDIFAWFGLSILSREPGEKQTTARFGGQESSQSFLTDWQASFIQWSTRGKWRRVKREKKSRSKTKWTSEGWPAMQMWLVLLRRTADVRFVVAVVVCPVEPPCPPPQPARPPSGRAPCRCHLFLARSKRSHAIKYRSGRLTRWANFNDSPALFFGGSHDDKRPFNWILHHSTGGDGPRCWIPSELPAVVDLVFRRKYSITTLANDVARTASHVMAGSTTVWGGFLSLRPLSPIINQIWSERPMYGAGDPNPFIRCVETRRKTALPRPTSLDPRTRIDGRP